MGLEALSPDGRIAECHWEQYSLRLHQPGLQPLISTMYFTKEFMKSMDLHSCAGLMVKLKRRSSVICTCIALLGFSWLNFTFCMSFDYI